MESNELIQFCIERGLLLDGEVLDLLSENVDVESAKFIIEGIKNKTQQTIITKNLFNQNKEKVNELLLNLPEERQKNFSKLKINLGLSIEITREEIYSEAEKDVSKEDFLDDVKVLSNLQFDNKKLEVKDFVSYFRNRFSEMRNILQEHSELTGLTSINKLTNDRQPISLIGIVSDKRITKNKNIIFEIEDLTGKTKVLVSGEKKELFELGEEVALDSVVGFRGFGNKEIVFANNIIFPESVLPERKSSNVEEYALFIGDLHFGSKLFLKDNFLKFIDYLNGKSGNKEEVDKIRYLFIVGDVVTGVGVYPGQEEDLEINNLEDQFVQLAEILGKIRKDIKIIISPGNHDGVRIMEPQPMFDEKFAWPLYDLENVILTGNPATVNIGIKKGFSGFNVLTYHGFSFTHYANTHPRLMKIRAMNSPEEIMKYLLKNRHLAPTHTSTQYFPMKEDALLIKEIPDILVSAHTHKGAISYYNNILIVSTSCWEAMTPYQEKFGNTPDHCKVPMFNLKTRAVKILDFE